MTDMAELPSEPSSWLSDRELRQVRSELPILYVNVVPVRTNTSGVINEVGLLLRADEGMMSRALVAGRVLFHETIREAILRNLEKDLGLAALPRVPLSPTPFTIAEYFPTPGFGTFHDARQHAVALSYVVAIDGDCEPSRTRSTSYGSAPKRRRPTRSQPRWPAASTYFYATPSLTAEYFPPKHQEPPRARGRPLERSYRRLASSEAMSVNALPRCETAFFCAAVI